MPIIDEENYIAFKNCTQIADDFERRVTIAALLTKTMKELGCDPPIIVGGTAVSIYSSGNYATMDIDFISNSEEKTKEVLFELGYVKQGKDYYHEELKSLVEFPIRNYLEDSNRFCEYILPHAELPIYLIGIEDLILDRMGSYAATNDLSSKEWATRLMLAYYGNLDWTYMHATSHKRGFFAKFEKIQQHVKYLRRNTKVDDVESDIQR